MPFLTILGEMQKIVGNKQNGKKLWYLFHLCRISSGVAPDVNIHESVSAQMKKGAAKAKWKVCTYIIATHSCNTS